MIFRNDFDFFGADVDSNGTPDCDQSYIGSQFAGCYVSNGDGTVRPFRDGVIASGTNQFGGDGAAEAFSAQSLIPRNVRYNANLLASYEYSSAATAFVEAKYVRTETRTQIRTTPFTARCSWRPITPTPRRLYGLIPHKLVVCASPAIS